MKHSSIGLWLVFFATTFSPSAFGMAPSVRSRNMPETCELVYQVESDIVLSMEALKNEFPPNTSHLAVHTRYMNAYNERETHLEERSYSLAVSADLSIPVTLMSFQTSQHRLLRKIIFEVKALDANESVLARWPQDANAYYLSEFARQFGEPCFNSGRSETPWRERAVTLFSE